jgi:carboxylate-amine ligase
MDEPAFTIGIEEEYLLVDVETCALARAPEALMAECAEALEGQVSPEFLQCQIEVGTRPHKTVTGAREDLAHLRRTVAAVAARH